MAKIPVGGATGLITKLLMLVGWKATINPADQERVDALHFLNFAEKLISQSEALKYLDVRTTIALLTATSDVAVPSAPVIDFGKDYWIETAGLDGLIPSSPPDEFAAMSLQNMTTGDRLTANPTRHLAALDGATTTMKFFFKPGNTSGSTMNLPITYQRIVPELIDDAASVSLLPETYEITLLLRVAELEIKRLRNEAGWEQLRDEVNGQNGQLDLFYSKFRANKKTTQTDANLERRKVEDDQLTIGR